MEADIAVKVEDVKMCYNMPTERVDSIKEYIVKLLRGKLHYREFVALDGVSITIKRGETVGIVGLNGSGKSTLLKIISGILKPDRGNVEINGVISPLIELGAGFDFELTTRENIFLNGSVLGFDRNFMRARYDDILDFAELRPYEDVAIKNFSSGMVARLGFAIATLVKPDILIVDEILAVGDALFQQKCEKRIAELMSGGTTVIIVSHAIEQIERLCTKVLWIDKGKQIMLGDTATVCEKYKMLGQKRGELN
ncbi:MAG: ABC transporter ATP-binding protein [Clostridia bacterium]|nr:ABC transporter ATP-binding protein [Clostridia bacterium]